MASDTVKVQLHRLLVSGYLDQAEVLIETYGSQGLTCNVQHPTTGRTALMDAGQSPGQAIARRFPVNLLVKVAATEQSRSYGEAGKDLAELGKCSHDLMKIVTDKPASKRHRGRSGRPGTATARAAKSTSGGARRRKRWERQRRRRRGSRWWR